MRYTFLHDARLLVFLEKTRVRMGLKLRKTPRNAMGGCCVDWYLHRDMQGA
jgi:hypothetical protein